MQTQQNKVDNILLSMLKENTGSHFLDSGGAYGRHWQENKGLTVAKLLKQESVIWNDGYYTISLFHYLRNQLDIDKVCEKFNRINKKANNWDSDLAYGLSIEGENFLLMLNAKISDAWNSYNGESSLSQFIQGSYVQIKDSYYVLLQIHGGCDVRGGYTDAYLFKITNEYQEFLNPEGVYGYVIKENGLRIEVDNRYNGYSLTDENGNEVEINENDKVELLLADGC